MSYREIRNFCEMMKSLGYPRVISMENFRIPNFKLVAEIIFWLVKRFDPKADIPDDIEDEKARVEFIKAACGFFHQNLKLTLNPKKIYSSDGHCVQELLKVTEILYNAKKSVSFGNDYDCGKELDITSRRNDIDNMKILSNEIVELGINLLDLLDKEKGLKFARETAIDYLDAISKNYDNQKDEEIEKKIMSILSNQEKAMEQLDLHVNELKGKENELAQDIQVKRVELERAEKRLESLYHAQPGHLAELASYENDLSLVYKTYVEKIRNHDYLQSRLEKYQRLEENNKRNIKGILELNKQQQQFNIHDQNDLLDEGQYDAEVDIEQYQRKAMNQNNQMRPVNNAQTGEDNEEEFEQEEEENMDEDNEGF